jgi:hypothetical protein
VTGGAATPLLAGPDADSSGAVVVTGSADLWIKTTVGSETDAVKIERVTLLGGGAVSPVGPLPIVLSVQGRTGAVVLTNTDVGAASPTDLSTGLATKVNTSTYTAGLAGKQDTATLGATVAADATVRAAFVPKWKPNTAYASGEPVLNPSGQTVTANSAFTSGATYSASNWTVVAGGGGSVSDASTSAKGIVQLAGDLAGTAAAPTVPGKAQALPAGRYDATGKPNGTATVMDTGQAIQNFGGAPGTVSSGALVNTPTGGSPTAAYWQTDLGATVGRIGGTFELNGTEFVTIVTPSATWTDGAGNLASPVPVAGAHFSITQTQWTYGVWTGGGGQVVIATGSLNLTPGAVYGVDLFFDTASSTAFFSLSDGTFAAVTDSRINTWRGTRCVWELYSNSSTDVGAKWHTFRADVETGAAAATTNDLARTRAQIVAQQTATSVIEDDFLGGTTTSGTAGGLGWTLVGGSLAKVNAEVGRPGIVQLSTGATSGTLTALYLDGTLTGSELIDLTFWVKLISVDSSTKVRVGLSSDPTVDAPAHAVYLERLGTDTNWWGAPRVANLTGPRVDTGVAFAAGWARVRIRQSQKLHFLCSINGSAEIDLNQYLPGDTEFIKPMVQITNSAAAAKTINVDKVRLSISGLTR